MILISVYYCTQLVPSLVLLDFDMSVVRIHRHAIKAIMLL